MGGADELDGAEPKDVEGPTEQAVATAANPVGGGRGGFDVIAFASRNVWLVVPLVMVVAIIVGTIQGPGAAILVLIAGALVGVIALFWSSVRTLLGEAPLSGADAYALAAPRAEEEQKQALLRALKDLEFERSVGKISDEDYNALVARYRTDAKRLLRVLDDEARPRRDRVESLVQERLVAAGIELAPAAQKAPPSPFTKGAPQSPFSKETPPSPFAKAEAKKGNKKKKAAKAADAAEAEAEGERGRRTVDITPMAEAPEEKKAGQTDVTQPSVSTTTKTKESAAYVPATKQCAECSTKNDPDAVFCKKCGSKSFETSASAKPSGDAAARANEDDDADENADEDTESEEAKR